MVGITLKNVDETLYRRLAEIARAHRHSLTKEILVALEQHLQHAPARDTGALLDRIRATRRRCKTTIATGDIRKWIDCDQHARPGQ